MEPLSAPPNGSRPAASPTARLDVEQAVGFLAIYLNDHRGGAAAGRALAVRCRDANRDGALGRYLTEFLDELDTDRTLLDDIRAAAGSRSSAFKQLAATVAAQLGRFKLNGRVASYSPLSRVIELESLLLGVQGKLEMWQVLEYLAPTVSFLGQFDLRHAQDRAATQLDRLRHFHREAVEGLVIVGR